MEYGAAQLRPRMLCARPSRARVMPGPARCHVAGPVAGLVRRAHSAKVSITPVLGCSTRWRCRAASADSDPAGELEGVRRQIDRCEEEIEELVKQCGPLSPDQPLYTVLQQKEAALQLQKAALQQKEVLLLQSRQGPTNHELVSRLTRLEKENLDRDREMKQLEKENLDRDRETKQLKEALERTKFTVSKETAVGKYFLNEKNSVLVDPQCMIETLDVTVDMVKYVADLNADTEVARQFQKARVKEEETQKAFEKLAEIANAQTSPPGLHAIGTSDYGFPGKDKVDLLVSTVPKPKKGEGKVAWTQVAGVAELKIYIGNEADYNFVMGQISDRFQELFKHQPRRSTAFALVGGTDNVELIQAFRNGRPARRTGRQALTLDEGSPGLLLLAAFFMAKKLQLGYKDIFLVPEFSVPALHGAEPDGGRGPWQVKSSAALWDTSSTGGQSGSTVFECTYTSTCTQEVVPAVLKCASAAEREAETLLLLNKKGVPHVPRLLDHGELKTTGASYLAITPVGQEVAFNATAEVILGIGLGVAAALEAMSDKCKVMHLDISPNNILIGPDGSALLIDFHLSSFSVLEKVFSGTEVYMACSRMETGEPTLSSELESLMYVLLFWACHGHLPWKRVLGTELMRYTKMGCMRDDFEKQIMKRCRPDLQPAMRALRGLFFEPSYCKTVKPQAFRDVLHEHLRLLQDGAKHGTMPHT